MSTMIEPSESDKRSIYKHPLFPLMALLFERCEQVTQTPDCPLVANLKVDIQSFVHHHQQRLVDFEQSIGERPEVDSLMIKSIQILWIHLLELDKVNELCKDFCTRYISCLRTKLQNEQLLHIDAFESDSNDVIMPDNGRMTSNNNNNSSTTNNSNNGNGGGQINYADIRIPPHHQMNMQENAMKRMHSSRDEMRGMGHHGEHLPPSHDQVSVDDYYRHHKFNKNNDDPEMQSSLSGVYPPNNNASGYTSPDLQQQNSNPMFPQSNNNSSKNGSRMGAVSPSLLAALEALDDGDYDAKSKVKKGTLPKQACLVLKSWIFQHLMYPYPTDEDKKALAEHTNLSLTQINNWFVNARRKVLQSPQEDGPSKNKKMKVNEEEEEKEDEEEEGLKDENRNGEGPSEQLRKSESRSETSTPTSTTFDCERTGQSEKGFKEGDENTTRAEKPLNDNQNNENNEKAEEKDNSFKNDQSIDKKEDNLDNNNNTTNEEKKTTDDDNNNTKDEEAVGGKRPEVGEDDDATDEN